MQSMKRILVILILGYSIVSCSKAQSLKLDDDQMKLIQTAYYINNLYVDTINSKQYTNDVIRAMLENLDPHSTYITTEDLQESEEPLQGEFEGIGVTFNMLTDTIFVIDVIQGGPSEKVGILSGDKIIKINDSIVAGKKIKNTDIVKQLRGNKGTKVNVDIQRRGATNLIPVTIIRDKIPIYSLDASFMVNDSIGYIKLSRFGATTHAEFVEAYNKLKDKGMTGLVLDLQGNGGGYLNAAIDIANEFLDKGDMIVYAEGSRFPKMEERAKGNGKFKDGKLVILVNDFSASASEIVAGAIQDQDRGLVVGRRTFGKGLVQRPLMLPDNSMIRLTVARYYTPAGRSIQKHYEPGKGLDYAYDLVNRFSNEMTDPDKIQFADSLKYETIKNKRPVYGGGGIMPDEYVVIDTTKVSPYYRKLYYNLSLIKPVQEEFDKNAKNIKSKYPTPEDFYKNYEAPEYLLQNIIKAGEDEGISFDKEEYEQSKDLIKKVVKVSLARDIYDSSLSYKIGNDDDENYKHALKLLSDDKAYQKLMKEGRDYSGNTSVSSVDKKAQGVSIVKGRGTEPVLLDQ